MKKGKKKSKIYFGRQAQEAVEEFLVAESTDQKHKIFNERLHAPFSKLIENIVFTYRFINLDESVEDLQLECLSHIYMNIYKYKPEKGKAFSYFGTMVKNYLIQKAIKLSKKKDIPLVDEMSENWIEQRKPLNREEDELELRTFNGELIHLLYQKLDENLKNIKNHSEKKVVQAILYLLEHKDELDLYNKKQLYVLLREITDLPTKKITQALNRVKSQYHSVRKTYLEEGC